MPLLALWPYLSPGPLFIHLAQSLGKEFLASDELACPLMELRVGRGVIFGHMLEHVGVRLQPAESGVELEFVPNRLPGEEYFIKAIKVRLI